MVPAPSIQADEQPRGNAQPIGQFFHTDQLCRLRQEPLLRGPCHVKKMSKRRAAATYQKLTTVTISERIQSAGKAQSSTRSATPWRAKSRRPRQFE